jgi:hypothetical protein
MTKSFPNAEMESEADRVGGTGMVAHSSSIAQARSLWKEILCLELTVMHQDCGRVKNIQSRMLEFEDVIFGKFDDQYIVHLKDNFGASIFGPQRMSGVEIIQWA